MSNHNLYAQIAARFPAKPEDKLFARLPDGRRYSYGDVDRVSAQFANLVRALGAMPGDRVAVQVEKSIEALMLYLGVVRAGCVFLPLNTGYPPAEVAYFLGDAKPALFICSPEKREALAPVARDAGARLETLGVYRTPRDDESVEAIAGTIAAMGLEAAKSFQTHENDGSDLAAILYTSGTTGRSKGAMLSHDNLASNSITLAEYWRFTPDDVLIHALPIFHTHGLFVATNVALFANASIILLQKFDAAEVLRWMPEATSMMGVPTFYTRLLDETGLTKDVASGMRLFVSGSAPLLAETHRAWTERTGHKILERAKSTLSIDLGRKKLTPDQLFGFDYGGLYRFFCLEADRGTEPKDTKAARKSYRSTIEDYAAFIGGKRYKQHYGLTAGMLLLYVFSSKSNERRFLETVSATLGSRSTYILTQTIPGFHAYLKPPGLLNQLTDEPWNRAKGEPFDIADAG